MQIGLGMKTGNQNDKEGLKGRLDAAVGVGFICHVQQLNRIRRILPGTESCGVNLEFGNIAEKHCTRQ